jgi:energy-coupling factor transporter ATP-binding protein EcfA2
MLGWHPESSLILEIALRKKKIVYSNSFFNFSFRPLMADTAFQSKKRARSGSKKDDEGAGSSSSDSEDKAKQPEGKKKKEGGKIFDPETGALSRKFKTFVKPSINRRGYGSTKELDDHPFLTPQIVLIVAPTGAGKTTLMLNILEMILEHVNHDKLGKVMFYTGSPQDDLIKMLDNESIDIYGPEQTETLLGDLRELSQKSILPFGPAERSKKFNVLILDDVVNSRDLSPNNAKGTDIGDILIRHRHIATQVFMLAQKFNQLPTFARTNASHLFIFPGKSSHESKDILSQVPLPKAQLEKQMMAMSSDPHAFMWIDLARRTAKRGFDQVVLE